MFEASESARERASEKVGEAKKKTTRTPNMMHCILFGIPKILNDSKGNCFFGVGLPSLVWLYVFPLSFSPKNKKKILRVPFEFRCEPHTRQSAHMATALIPFLFSMLVNCVDFWCACE